MQIHHLETFLSATIDDEIDDPESLSS